MIGYTTGDWNIGRSGVHYIFRFTVAHTKYESADVGTGNKVEKGTRFVIKYDSLSPGNNIGYFEYPVPDSIHRLPPTAGSNRPFLFRSGFSTALGEEVVSEEAANSAGNNGICPPAQALKPERVRLSNEHGSSFLHCTGSRKINSYPYAMATNSSGTSELGL